MRKKRTLEQPPDRPYYALPERGPSVAARLSVKSSPEAQRARAKRGALRRVVPLTSTSSLLGVSFSEKKD